MKFHPWRFRETFKGAVNRRKVNLRYKVRNYIQEMHRIRRNHGFPFSALTFRDRFKG